MGEEDTVNSSVWSRDQDKAFENALASYAEDASDRWEKISADVPGKTPEEIKQHYELLLDDINRIESGSVPLPCYNSSSPEGSTGHAAEDGTGKKGGHVTQFGSDSNHGGKASRSDQERRKGIAWSEEEHRLFLQGLEKYGKGDWRSISRNFVITRTPTQVASHAQKYFIRLNSMNKDRRRSSIHDITSVGNGEISAPEGPITGQTNTNAATNAGGTSSGRSSKQPSQAPGSGGISMYSGGTTIGQPVVGTPVNMTPSPHLGYGVRAPTLVPGAPMNMGGHMAYPMPHTSAHR